MVGRRRVIVGRRRRVMVGRRRVMVGRRRRQDWEGNAMRRTILVK